MHMIHFILIWTPTLWLALLIIWLLAAIGNKRSVTYQSLSSRLFQIGLEFAGFWLLLDRGIDSGWLATPLTPRTAPLIYTGLAITLLGMAFCFWARAVLGRNWSATVTIKQGHQLVRRGPYRIVRHPIYTGLIFAALGTTLIYGQLRCFLGVALIALGWWLKLRIEERFMLQQFGEEYIRYRREVRALIPFVL